MTTNDYLAKRDRDQMGQIHEFLGLTVGAVLSGMDAQQRRAAYPCDITYVTNSQLGLDYLRDNMAVRREQVVQRGFDYAIIDEADSVLIDNARTPLILSGESERSTRLYEACDTLACRMNRSRDLKSLSRLDVISGVEQEETGDFIVDEKEKRVLLTEAGIRRTERYFRVENSADLQNLEIQHHMDLALRANNLLERDTDYVVRDGEVLIVDGLTGRIMPGRRYSDGLHQAIEAKERVRIRRENRTAAKVTYQNFFNQYAKKSGMTGTGRTEAWEFAETYGMDILEIPTDRLILRIDREDVVFRTKQEKLEDSLLRLYSPKRLTAAFDAQKAGAEEAVSVKTVHETAAETEDAELSEESGSEATLLPAAAGEAAPQSASGNVGLLSAVTAAFRGLLLLFKRKKSEEENA